jgi:hypothetical protein
MSTEDDDAGKATEPTFTRAQMAKMVNAQVREKVAAALAEYGDLDELRTRAAEADKQKSQLDRIEQQLADTQKRAEKAERDGLVRRVADDLGISMRLAGKLSGKTYEELLADGKDTMDDLGLKPKAKNGTKATSTDGDATDGDGEDGAQETQAEDETQATSRQTATTRTARPRETLRSGAARTPTAPEVTNPMELVKNIPRY